MLLGQGASGSSQDLRNVFRLSCDWLSLIGLASRATAGYAPHCVRCVMNYRKWVFEYNKQEEANGENFIHLGMRATGSRQRGRMLIQWKQDRGWFRERKGEGLLLSCSGKARTLPRRDR